MLLYIPFKEGIVLYSFLYIKYETSTAKSYSVSFFHRIFNSLFCKTDTDNKYTFTIKMFRLQQNIHVYIADIKCKQQSILSKSATSEPPKNPALAPGGVWKRHDVELIHILRIDVRVSHGKKPRHTLGSD